MPPLDNTLVRAGTLSGPQRAAVVLLALGDKGRPLWQMLDEEEIKLISSEIAQLGNVRSELVESLFGEVIKLAASVPLRGDVDATRRLLLQLLPAEQVEDIMDQMEGPYGRTMYQKLSNVSPHLLANYLKSEHPQTIAVVLSRLYVDHTARVLLELPPRLAEDVVCRMLFMGQVPREILERIDETLRTELFAGLNRQRRHNPLRQVAEVITVMGRAHEERFIGSIGRSDQDAADSIRTMIFSFDRLVELDGPMLQALLRSVDRDVLVRALKGAPDDVRNVILANVTSRAAQSLRHDMASLGPLRLREIDEAQIEIMRQARALEAEGLIDLSPPTEDEELVLR